MINISIIYPIFSLYVKGRIKVVWEFLTLEIEPVFVGFMGSDIP
jgi:hypothetical protein